MSFRNNLQKGDPVMTRRHQAGGEGGCAAPREFPWNEGVVAGHAARQIREDISKLRLVVNGKPEDVPPYDGELPAPRTPTSNGHRQDPEDDVLGTLQAQRDQIVARMSEMNAEYKRRQAQVEHIDRAIEALKE